MRTDQRAGGQRREDPCPESHCGWVAKLLPPPPGFQTFTASRWAPASAALDHHPAHGERLPGSSG